MRWTLLLLALAACRPSPPPPEPPHVITIGDAAIDAPADTCSQACTVLRALGCPEGESIGEGYSCEMMCGLIGDDFDFGCIARARSTDSVRACNVRCVYPADGGP